LLNINSNYSSQFTAQAAKNTQYLMDKSVERLSTGKRINSAKDDPAGHAIASRLNAEIRSLAVANKNAAQAQDLIDTATYATEEAVSLNLRIRELAVQASNETLNNADRATLQNEVKSLEEQIAYIADKTRHNGIRVVSGDMNDDPGVPYLPHFQVGSDPIDTISISLYSLTTGELVAYPLSFHFDDGNVSVGTISSAQRYISWADVAIKNYQKRIGNYAAVSNRLDNIIANLDQIRVNLSVSKGRIEDTDFAVETSDLARNQILKQAATAMLAQANSSKSVILTLVQLE
jgi:flagellin